MKRLLIILILGLGGLTSYSQTSDTITAHNIHCVSFYPWGSDTSYYYWSDDTLIIRREHYANCCADIFGIMHKSNDSITVQSVDTNTMLCLCDCIIGYTFKIPVSKDTIYLYWRGEFIVVAKFHTYLSNVDRHIGNWIYPNPTNDIIYISVSSFLNGQIKIYDLKGAIVYETNQLERTLSLDKLHIKSGIYIVAVYTDNQILKKLVIKE